MFFRSGSESVEDSYRNFEVEANLCGICIEILEWKRICGGFVLIVWSENESVEDLY